MSAMTPDNAAPKCVLCSEELYVIKYDRYCCTNTKCPMPHLPIRAHEALSAKLGRQDEVGWLVEAARDNQPQRYRTMDQGIPIWTTDANKALRFCRREDAELFAAEDEDAWHIVEHIWVDTPPRYPKMLIPMLRHQWSDGDIDKYCLRCRKHWPQASIQCEGSPTEDSAK